MRAAKRTPARARIRRMLLRGLVVLLLVLNLGVALWWALRAPPSAPEASPLPPGAVRLQLLSELPADARAALDAAPPPATTLADGDAPDATPADTAATPTPVTPDSAVADMPVATPEPAVQRCIALGPFADAATADAARGRLGAGATSVRARTATSTASGWRVMLPAAADRAAAQETVARIAAAGINDYFIVADGAEANSIALGRYRSEQSARQREATLRAAGFPAEAQPLGAATTIHWLDVALAAGTDTAAARTAAGASRADTVDCAAVR